MQTQKDCGHRGKERVGWAERVLTYIHYHVLPL